MVSIFFFNGVTVKTENSRAVHKGGGGGGGGGCPRQENFLFFSNIVFEFAELFLEGCSKITTKSTN